MDFTNELKTLAELFEDELSKMLKRLSEEIYNPLYLAMEYSLKSGGKRIRPVLTLAVAKMIGVDFSRVMPFCLAVECIHAYSLIHDDLPAMDNDDFRRFKPTNHRVFGEAYAILAGDALLNLAFETLFNNAGFDKDLKSYINACSVIADCSGAKGMIAGQALDMAEQKSQNKETLHLLQLNKTAKLIYASVVPVGILAGLSEKKLEALREFAINLGLAFQTTDDILDATSDIEKVGKSTKKDERLNKLTSVKVLGLEKGKELACDYTENAIKALKAFKNSEFLRQFARDILEREK
ncbi:MAG: polyprenyl synthetase family protein [Firmicutes bacterium]|nr:polyprenyl synthetase family protein [Bacillota bacterium]